MRSVDLDCADVASHDRFAFNTTIICNAVRCGGKSSAYVFSFCAFVVIEDL